MKICNTCITEKPNTAFGKHHTNRDGLNGTCKECTNEAARKKGNGFMAELRAMGANVVGEVAPTERHE